MADAKSIPTIFLSYAWANKAEADALDADFERIGITLKRDIRDVEYSKSIKEFMQQIGHEDFAIVLISDEFLHSANCMHEVTELLGTHKFEQRILPVLIGNAGGIFNVDKRAAVKRFWKERLKEKERLLKLHPDEDFIDEVVKVQNIVLHLGSFFLKIKDLKAETLSALKNENYKSLLNKVGFDKDHVLVKVVEISKMEDEEEQELALDDLLKVHQNNYIVWFEKSQIANRQGAIKKEKWYLEQSIAANPEFSYAQNNLGVLLTKHFGEHAKAKEYYLEAIHSNPDNAEAHYNLGSLLTERFGEHKKAIEHFTEAIRINPGYAEAHNNLGILLTKYLGEHNRAMGHYLESLRLDPTYAEAHFNLAILFLEISNDLRQAQKHYKKSIELNPSFKTEEDDKFFLVEP